MTFLLNTSCVSKDLLESRAYRQDVNFHYTELYFMWWMFLSTGTQLLNVRLNLGKVLNCFPQKVLFCILFSCLLKQKIHFCISMWWPKASVLTARLANAGFSVHSTIQKSARVFWAYSTFRNLSQAISIRLSWSATDNKVGMALNTWHIQSFDPSVSGKYWHNCTTSSSRCMLQLCFTLCECEII